jgi:hypothetical protein
LTSQTSRLENHKWSWKASGTDWNDHHRQSEFLQAEKQEQEMAEAMYFVAIE